MQWLNVMRGMLVLVVVLALAGCGGGNSWDIEVLPWIHDIQGTYQAREPIGDWGCVAMQLERKEFSRVYNATLANPFLDFFRTRDGIGTLANDHVILNFDTGLSSDFYFEGDVIVNEGVVESIEGQFIFPDQGDPLPVIFDRL